MRRINTVALRILDKESDRTYLAGKFLKSLSSLRMTRWMLSMQLKLLYVFLN